MWRRTACVQDRTAGPTKSNECIQDGCVGKTVLHSSYSGAQLVMEPISRHLTKTAHYETPHFRQKTDHIKIELQAAHFRAAPSRSALLGGCSSSAMRHLTSAGPTRQYEHSRTQNDTAKTHTEAPLQGSFGSLATAAERGGNVVVLPTVQGSLVFQAQAKSQCRRQAQVTTRR